VALAPARAYRELTLLKTTDTWLVAFTRPAFIALLIGTLVAISSTGLTKEKPEKHRELRVIRG